MQHKYPSTKPSIKATMQNANISALASQFLYLLSPGK